MTRLLGIIAICCLGGCAGISDHHVSYLQSKCDIYGFERETPAFSRCYQEESDLWWDQIRKNQL